MKKKLANIALWITDRYRNWGLSQKTCILFTSILAISILLTYTLSVHFYARSIERTTESMMVQAANSVVLSFNNTMEMAELITNAPNYSSELLQAFRDGQAMTLSQLKGSRLLFMLLNSMPLSSRSIGFFSADGTLIFKRAIYGNSAVYSDNYELWQSVAWENQGSSAFLSLKDNASYSAAVVRAVMDPVDYTPIGLAAILISTSGFEKSFSQLSDISGSRVVVLDSLDQIIYDSEGSPTGTSVNNVPLLSVMTELPSQFNEHINGTKYFGIRVDHPNKKYQVLIYSPHEALMQELTSTRWIVLCFLTLICVVSFTLIAAVSQQLTKPLKKITQLLQRVREGDFSVRFHSQTQDEIGILGDSFNMLLERLEQQIEEKAAFLNKEKQMEVDILKSQINPHFIYNTLETIHMMAVDADQNEIEKVTQALGWIMRYNITKINETTTLRQELTYLRDYLYIQNVRFENRFSLDEDIPSELMDCQILKMLLQPIVENAIVHGFEPSGRAGTISIRATPCSVGQHITISDNGVGMSQQQLEQLQLQIQTGSSVVSNSHIGLKNVHNRIQLYYGTSYGLEVCSTAGEGTVVQLTIPMIGADENHANCDC